MTERDRFSNPSERDAEEPKTPRETGKTSDLDIKEQGVKLPPDPVEDRRPRPIR